MTLDYRLFLITEETPSLPTLLHTVEEAVKGGVKIVELREKKSTPREIYEKAKQLKEMLSKYNVPLIIDNRPDIALASGADGVHLAQHDLPLHEVRKMLPAPKIVGTSVFTVEQAQEAEKNGADYVATGAIFPTTSKDNATVLPEEMLEKITKSVSIPVIAVGGLKPSNLAKVNDKGIAGVAVVSGVMQAENPYEAAEQYIRALEQ